MVFNKGLFSLTTYSSFMSIKPTATQYFFSVKLNGYGFANFKFPKATLEETIPAPLPFSLETNETLDEIDLVEIEYEI